MLNRNCANAREQHASDTQSHEDCYLGGWFCAPRRRRTNGADDLIVCGSEKHAAQQNPVRDDVANGVDL
jgi:hypothetical protein